VDDQGDQVKRINAAAHPAVEAAGETADPAGGRAAAPRFVEPAAEPEEDLTEAGYGHGV
jgi:hypothetical protein